MQGQGVRRGGGRRIIGNRRRIVEDWVRLRSWGRRLRGQWRGRAISVFIVIEEVYEAVDSMGIVIREINSATTLDEVVAS